MINTFQHLADFGTKEALLKDVGTKEAHLKEVGTKEANPKEVGTKEAYPKVYLPSLFIIIYFNFRIMHC